MRTIEKEKKSFYEVFVANDGTEFTDRDECRKYEESAKGVLMAKIRPLVVKETTMEDLWGIGSCDNTMWIVKVDSQDAADIIMQVYLFVNEHLLSGEFTERVERARALVQRAFVEGEFLFIECGYEMDGFYFIGTPNTMKDDLDKLCVKHD